jgi:biotin transport system substrate-specific component
MSKFFSVRGLIFSALFAAMLVVFSFVSIPLGFTPVPVTLQTLAVMLAGACLGPLYGFYSILLVVVLTALGLPLLHGSGGLAVILGPTGGYIVAWPLSALLIGWSMSRIRGTGVKSYIYAFGSAMLFGGALDYAVGVPWLAYTVHLPFGKAMIEGCYPYLPGDAIKAAVAALVAVPVRQAFPPARLTGAEQAQVIRLSDDASFPSGGPKRG